jgi:hypothetical protein
MPVAHHAVGVRHWLCPFSPGVNAISRGAHRGPGVGLVCSDNGRRRWDMPGQTHGSRQSALPHEVTHSNPEGHAPALQVTMRIGGRKQRPGPDGADAEPELKQPQPDPAGPQPANKSGESHALAVQALGSGDAATQRPPWHVPRRHAVPFGFFFLHLPRLRFLQGGQFLLASVSSRANPPRTRPSAPLTAARARRRDPVVVRERVRLSKQSASTAGLLEATMRWCVARSLGTVPPHVKTQRPSSLSDRAPPRSGSPARGCRWRIPVDAARARRYSGAASRHPRILTKDSCLGRRSLRCSLPVPR